jgi:hypothetical protein
VLADLATATADFDFNSRYASLAQPYFHLRDGLAADRIADVLADVPATPRAPQLAESLRSSSLHPRALQRGQALLANLLGSRRASDFRARLQPRRMAKRLELAALRSTIAAAARASGEPMPGIRRHRHPFTGAAMASIEIYPQDGQQRTWA